MRGRWSDERKEKMEDIDGRDVSRFRRILFLFLGRGEGEGKLCLAWVIDFGRKFDRIVFHGRVELSM